MHETLVSILIPVFNAEKTVARAIESCLKQSYRNIEVLVLDDASTDNTCAVVEKFTNVRLLKHDKNRGTPAARNALLREAKGEFIAWLDADDTMMPERIQRQVSFMLENPLVDIAGSWIYTDNDSLPRKKLPTGNAVIKAHLWFKNCMVQPSVISKNFYVRDGVFYDEGFYYMQDYELWFRLRNRKVFANIPECLTRYHFSSQEETEEKHRRFHAVQNPDQLWSAKWKESGFGLDEVQKKSLQKFLSKSEKMTAEEACALRIIFNKISTDKIFRNVKENLLMVHLYRLLVFKRLNNYGRLKHLGLLKSLSVYTDLKKMYLIQ